MCKWVTLLLLFNVSGSFTHIFPLVVVAIVKLVLVFSALYIFTDVSVKLPETSIYLILKYIIVLVVFLSLYMYLLSIEELPTTMVGTPVIELVPYNWLAVRFVVLKILMQTFVYDSMLFTLTILPAGTLKITLLPNRRFKS
jgi:hypothetical protein